MIKYAKLNFHLDIKELQSEVTNMLGNSEWSPHLNQSHYSGNWDVLALRSPGGNTKCITADLLGENIYADTQLMQQFPSVQMFLASLCCPIMSVRLLNLKAGAIIKSHRDFDLCFEKGEARIHVPVFTNPGVEFFIEEERIEMKEGESWYINANNLHRVSNMGSADRIHLVFDCRVNNWLKTIFEEGEKVFAGEQENKSDIRKIIHELRLLNTDVSNKLAEELLQQTQS
jgi:mannose-6-phosphate isomerase-like protein (cupin superfamily)